MLAALQQGLLTTRAINILERSERSHFFSKCGKHIVLAFCGLRHQIFLRLAFTFSQSILPLSLLSLAFKSRVCRSTATRLCSTGILAPLTVTWGNTHVAGGAIITGLHRGIWCQNTIRVNVKLGYSLERRHKIVSTLELNHAALDLQHIRCLHQRKMTAGIENKLSLLEFASRVKTLWVLDKCQRFHQLSKQAFSKMLVSSAFCISALNCADACTIFCF